MEDFELSIYILGIILCYILYLGIKGKKIEIDNETVDIDNPYHIKTSPMPLDKYEEELNSMLDYESSIIPLSKPTLDESVYENMNITDEDRNDYRLRNSYREINDEDFYDEEYEIERKVDKK